MKEVAFISIEKKKKKKKKKQVREKSREWHDGLAS